MRVWSRFICAGSLCAAMLLAAATLPAAAATTPLPPLRNGSVVTGPGQFRHDGPLRIHGNVTLRQMDLDLRGPIQVDAGARLVLDHVHLRISDPPGTPNGTSGLACAGPADIVIRDSQMTPVGAAHPMWELRGRLDVDGFQTLNSEFHLHGVQARLRRLRIFELQVHPGTQLQGDDLDLVFLSDFVASADRLRFSHIPSGQWFSRTLHLGGGAVARLTHARAQIFLVYIQGHGNVALSHLGRVQIALFPHCSGRLHLPRGHLGSAARPAIFPDPKQSDCAFRVSLDDVNVDTWDVYTGGHARLTLDHSYVDELNAFDDAHVTIRNSVLLADWLAIGGHAQVRVSHSRVGALSMVRERPDLATSQVRVTGDARARFGHVRFDCGIYAGDRAHVTIVAPAAPPTYVHREQQASVVMLPAGASPE